MSQVENIKKTTGFYLFFEVLGLPVEDMLGSKWLIGGASSFMLGQVGSMMGHVGSSWPILAHLGAVLGSLGRILGPSWGHLGLSRVFKGTTRDTQARAGTKGNWVGGTCRLGWGG